MPDFRINTSTLFYLAKYINIFLPQPPLILIKQTRNSSVAYTSAKQSPTPIISLTQPFSCNLRKSVFGQILTGSFGPLWGPNYHSQLNFAYNQKYVFFYDLQYCHSAKISLTQPFSCNLRESVFDQILTGSGRLDIRPSSILRRIKNMYFFTIYNIVQVQKYR